MNYLEVFTPFQQGYILTMITITGLLIGSFLNVVALRLLSEESIVFPNSKCPKCSKPIKWYDNIPVLSYILLGGKCRNCKEKISIQYPIVEATTGLLFLAIFLIGGFTLKTISLWILVSALIVITLTDLKEQVIFDITSIPLIPLGLIYNFFDIGHSGLGTRVIHLAGINSSITLNEAFISALIAAIFGALFFEIISRIGVLMVGQRAFGEGDSIIAAALGAWFGWPMIAAIIIMSFIFQVIIGIPVILHNMYKDKDFKSLGFTCLLLFSVFIPLIGRSLSLTDTLTGALSVTILSFLCAGIGVYVILNKAKERQSFTFLPFGPALVAGGLVVMFWGDLVISTYLNLL